MNSEIHDETITGWEKLVDEYDAELEKYRAMLSEMHADNIQLQKDIEELKAQLNED